METELLLGPIVGGLSHERVFLWGRIAPPGEEEAILHAWIGRQADLSDARLAGKSLPLAPEQGYAGVAPVNALQPGTRYYYALTLNDKPPPIEAMPPGGEFPCFKTFPAPRTRQDFSFAFGSCFQPGDESGGQIFEALEARRKRDANNLPNVLRFILMIGDQIYADKIGNNGLDKVAESLEDFRAVYHTVWGNRKLRRLLANLPAFMTLDDHEVDDDWHWQDAERQNPAIPWWDRLARFLKGRPLSERRLTLERVRNALQAYWEHQGMHAPPLAQSMALDGSGQLALAPGDPGSLAYSFEYGGAAFFVLDTRTMRVRGRGRQSMLGEGQWRLLEAWLLAVKDSHAVKFLVTSCALLFQTWSDIPRDRWVGFPRERDRLISFIALNDIHGLHLLAGDLHSAHAVRAELYGPNEKSIPLWEFCSSPFEQKTNWLTKYTRLPLLNGLLRSQDCKFVVDKINFGIVRVKYDNNGRPVVAYEVYGQGGELLAHTNTAVW